MSRGRKATWRKSLGMLKKRHNLCMKDLNAGKNTTSINTSYFIICCFHEKNRINIWITLTLSHMCLIVWVVFSSSKKFGFTLMYKILKYLTIITLNICLVHSFLSFLILISSIVSRRKFKLIIFLWVILLSPLFLVNFYSPSISNYHLLLDI